MLLRYSFTLILLILSATTSANSQSPMSWPIYSKQQLQGLEIIQSLRSANLIINDPYIQTYAQNLGQHIAYHSDLKDRAFRFYVINDASINAFALPGDYIVIHTGLIQASENENELAAVIAHEIAHLTQNHIERRSERTSEYQIPLTIATLLAIGLSGGDSQVTGAAISTLQAGSAENFVNTTREYEHEADRIGINTLSSAGFDPNGMVSFFEKLNAQDTSNMPEYLRTHPLTANRIHEAKSRAEQANVTPTHNADEYAYIKDYLNAFLSNQQAVFSAKAKQSLTYQNSYLKHTDTSHLAVMKHLKNRQALIQQLQRSPFTAEIHRLIAQRYHQDNNEINSQIHTALALAYEGNIKQAGHIIRRLHTDNPKNPKVKALWESLPTH